MTSAAVRLPPCRDTARLSGWIAALGLLVLPAQAQLRIEITSGVSDPIGIAVVPFAQQPEGSGTDLAAIVQRNLESSGRFRGMAREAHPGRPSRGDEVEAAAWRAARSDYVVVGRMVALEGTRRALDIELVSLLKPESAPAQQRISSQRIVFDAARERNAAHRAADFIYERILGVRGAFATRIAYVSVDGAPPQQRFQLILADADGENPRVITESRRPIMSPAFSPDGEWLAYVSFENRVSAVYVQLLRTGERRRVSARAGINGAPAWSPDGRKLALTLGGSNGNLDIYILDLATQGLTRITDDPGIDTEAQFSGDGSEIYFTSDRSGGPQIYRLMLRAGERPRRVTFGSGYNARPRISPDGRTLALVTLEGGNYRIAVQDLSSGVVRVLTQGRFDESPSFSPNGAALIYSGLERGAGVLAAVAVDGLATQRLKADRGQVREPVWGPF